MSDMKRRAFITLLGGAAAAWPIVARAQQAAEVFRLGQLSGGTAASHVPLLAAFMRGMRGLGYVEGQNLVVEHRYAEGRFEVLPALARELLAWTRSSPERNPPTFQLSSRQNSISLSTLRLRRALGLEIPLTLLARADEVIE
jgi:hypothetical protein